LSPDLFVEGGCQRRTAAPMGEIDDAQNSNSARQRNGEHVIPVHGVGGGFGTLSIHTNISCGNKRGGHRSRLYDTRVPEPAINSLLRFRREALSRRFFL